MSRFLGIGNGRHGQINLSTYAQLKYACSGSSGSFSLTSTGSFVTGDRIFIIQFRGTNVGGYEDNIVKSYSGGVITTVYPLERNYSSTDASKAQVLIVKEASSVSGTHTISSWNGSTGGQFVIACNGTASGTINGNGYSQVSSGGARTIINGGGYRGGPEGIKNGGEAEDGRNGWYAEGSSNASAYSPYPVGPNGNGGGGGDYDPGRNKGGGGAGGGNGGAGGEGGYNNTDISPATVAGGNDGVASGNSTLTSMVPAGGGGGGAGSSGNHGEPGGNGGANVVIYAYNFLNMNINLSGGNGADCGGRQWEAPGGGGAGGNLLIKAVKVSNYGTINMIGGNGGLAAGNQTGGGGGGGRVRIEACSFAGSSPSVSGGTQGVNSFGGYGQGDPGSSGTYSLSEGGHSFCKAGILGMTGF